MNPKALEFKGCELLFRDYYACKATRPFGEPGRMGPPFNEDVFFYAQPTQLGRWWAITSVILPGQLD